MSFVLDEFTRSVHATLTISHTQCAVVFSHNGIAEVSGLPEYVASTTSHDHKQPYNDRSLIDTDGTKHDQATLSAEPPETYPMSRPVSIFINSY